MVLTFSCSMIVAVSAITPLASLVFLRLMKTMPPSQQTRPTVPAHNSSLLAMVVQRSGKTSIMPASDGQEGISMFIHFFTFTPIARLQQIFCYLFSVCTIYFDIIPNICQYLYICRPFRTFVSRHPNSGKCVKKEALKALT